jgi:hypothetical protein
MKIKIILIYLFLIFSLKIIAQDNNSTDNINSKIINNDLTCVANFLKKNNAISQEDYNKVVNNKETVNHLGTNLELDKKSVILHFFKTGSFFIENTENKKTLFDGIWGCLNNNNFIVKAPSKENGDVFYFNSETGEMNTVKNKFDSKIVTEVKDEPIPFESVKKGTTYDDFYEKPKKSNNSSNVESNKEPTKWASKLGEEVLSKLDMDKMGKEMGKILKRDLSGKPGVAKGCISCHGTGIVKICPICNKTGKKHCRSCNGNRYTRDGRTCLACSGTGIVICDGCKGKIYNIKCLHNIFQFQY